MTDEERTGTQGMRFTARQHAPGDSRFQPRAFDRNIGKVVPMLLEGMPGNAWARVAAVEVVDDGRAVLITYEVVDGPA